MKRFPALSACLLAGVFAFSPLVAQSHDHDMTPLGEQMEKMSDAFKDLRKQVADPDQTASSLALLATMREAATASLEFDPAYTADQPEADRAAFLAEYHQQIEQLIGALDQAATALKANDHAAAAALVNDLRTAQRSGHKQFRKPKD